MIWSLVLAVLAAPLFGCCAPVLSRRINPSWATWILALGGLSAAFASGTALALLTFLLLGRSVELASYWGWSHATLLRHNDIPLSVSIVAAIALGFLVGRSIRASVIRARALRRCYALAATLGSTELVVTDEPSNRAVAVPGRPGKIVLSQGLLAHLDPVARTVVIAHERAHLQHRHHWPLTAGVISAAANPFLTPVREAIALSTERWADEDASAVADRRSVAQALVQFGGGRPQGGSALDDPAHLGRGALASARATAVKQRVLALLEPPRQDHPWRLALLVAVSVAPAVSFLCSWLDVERLYELAQRDFTLGH